MTDFSFLAALCATLIAILLAFWLIRRRKSADKKLEDHVPDEIQASPTSGATEIGTQSASDFAKAPSVPAPAAKPSATGLWQRALQKTRTALLPSLSSDTSLRDSLEESLILADVGVQTASKLADLCEQDGLAPHNIRPQLRKHILALLDLRTEAQPSPHKPEVILVIGVNGAGKTTSIGKLAAKYAKNGKKPHLVAGDTFRAAAVEQLRGWARRVGCDITEGSAEADPSSVIYDGIRQAQQKQVDVVICDTAGRLHTKKPLMDELAKVYRTAAKVTEREKPDRVLLVLDATNGQNALRQAQQFGERLQIDGIILTKLDGSAKGGIVLAIADQLKLPICYVGTGEKIEDFAPFDPIAFVDALLMEPAANSDHESAENSPPVDKVAYDHNAP